MIRALLLLLAASLAFPALAQPLPLESLQLQDRRLAAVAERIMGANAGLCRKTMSLTGLTMHSADQYSAEAAALLIPEGPLAIAAVLPDAPAAAAGLLPGDRIVAIGTTNVDSLDLPEGRKLYEQAFDLLASQPPDQPLSLLLQRNDRLFEAKLAPRAGCRALVEIVAGPAMLAQADGRVIQLSFAMAEMLDDDGLAAIFAHELAHVVLDHRARLEAAGVAGGLAGEVGRNRRLRRQVEVEADRMSVHLLANAGYDPAIAPALRRSATGRRLSGGLFRDRAYPSWRERAELMEAEIASHIATGPDHLLALRDQPFAP